MITYVLEEGKSISRGGGLGLAPRILRLRYINGPFHVFYGPARY